MYLCICLYYVRMGAWGSVVVKALRYRTVPGSIPSGVTGFCSDISPSDRSMALGSTQPLVKMSTRNIPGDKGGRCVRMTTSPPSRAECHEIEEPKPPGTLWATPGLLRDSFTFTMYVCMYVFMYVFMYVCKYVNGPCEQSRSNWVWGKP